MPLCSSDGFTALSHNSRAPCKERCTSVTTLKSGKTRTVSRSSSWHNVLWLPFKTPVLFDSELRKRPGAVFFTWLGDEGLGASGGRLEVISVIAAASEFLSSVILLLQSDFPVEIII